MQLFDQAERLKDAPLSKIREIIEYSGKLEKEGKSIIHLEIGEPDFDTPQHLVDAAKKALDNQEVHYGPVMGIMELRQAIADHMRKNYALDYEAGEVMVTSGVAHGIFLAIMAYLNPGDEIIVPDPGYLCYFTVPNIAGAKAVSWLLSEENNFQADETRLEAIITPNTKAILLNSPSNPLGSVLNKKSLEVIAKLAQKHNLLVITDEVYADMTYNGEKAPSIAALPGMKARCIVLNGFSKYYAMTGWRLGYLLCDQSLMNPIMRLNFYNLSCPNTFIQKAGLAALTQDDASSQAMVKEYQIRRDYMVQALNNLPGCSCRMPEGAFYIFLNIQGTGLDENTFSRRLLEEAGVTTTPGNVFGKFGQGYVRISYANSLANLKEAVMRMRKFLEQCKK